MTNIIEWLTDILIILVGLKALLTIYKNSKFFTKTPLNKIIKAMTLFVFLSVIGEIIHIIADIFQFPEIIEFIGFSFIILGFIIFIKEIYSKIESEERFLKNS